MKILIIEDFLVHKRARDFLDRNGFEFVTKLPYIMIESGDMEKLAYYLKARKIELFEIKKIEILD